MNNFLELLDTDPYLSVSINLSAITDAGIPTVMVRINGQCLFNEPMAGTVSVTSKIHCQKPFNIEIQMQDKQYQQTVETAVIINALSIDSYNLVPNFTHLAHYHNDHDRDEPTSYLGWNGTWSIKSERPFYQWLHQHTGQGWLLEPI